MTKGTYRSKCGWSLGLALVAFLAAAPLSASPRLDGWEGEPSCDDASAVGCGQGKPVDPARERQLRQLEHHLSERMKGLDPALHEDLALVILEESEAAQVDARLVLAVIEVESGYDPTVVSAVGARGLMQLLPGTLQREAGGPRGQASAADDPIANVRGGIRYLRRCLDSYPDPGDALMAYNAGPNRLHAWHLAGAVPGEVRGYARRVLAGQERLRRILPVEVSPPQVTPRHLASNDLSARAG